LADETVLAMETDPTNALLGYYRIDSGVSVHDHPHPARAFLNRATFDILPEEIVEVISVVVVPRPGIDPFPRIRALVLHEKGLGWITLLTLATTRPHEVINQWAVKQRFSALSVFHRSLGRCIHQVETFIFRFGLRSWERRSVTWADVDVQDKAALMCLGVLTYCGVTALTASKKVKANLRLWMIVAGLVRFSTTSVMLRLLHDAQGLGSFVFLGT